VIFYIPLYKDGSVPVWKVRLGLRLLEMLDPGGVPLDIARLSPAEARRDPALAHLRAPDGLLGVLRFTEHQYDWPERICVDTVLNARDAGADVRNYARVERVERGADGLWVVEAVDLRTNAAITFSAKAIVNATGAWIDQVAQRSNLPVPRLNQGAKGTNVVVRLPPEFRGIGFETIMRDGAPFYIIPWDDLHYFGPKDKPAEPTPQGFRAEEDEIADLLAEMNHLLPSLRLTRRDVLYTWAGVRPRTFQPDHPAGGMSTLLHDFGDRGLPGYYTYTGGLIMTHRHAGRWITAAVGKRVQPSRASRPVVHASRLLPAGEAPLRPHYGSVSVPNLVYAAARENVQTLEDLMFRRVRLGWSERMGADVAVEVAEHVRDAMGWSAATARRQADDYVAFLRREFNLAV
jgi:glycerol-3-phosphate dehydrogenase